ncbi:MAG TPA: DNA recombination protein RmuC [Candidatus Paceibacterota bacterium]
MPALPWIISAALLAALVAAVVLLRRPGKGGVGEADSASKLLLEQINQLGRSVEAKLSSFGESMERRVGGDLKEVRESVRAQSDQALRAVRDVTDRLAKLDETNRQVVGFADQLQDLQDILKNPKNRGVLGEYYLETLLKNVMPPGSYQMQYAFKNGDIVDAVVFVKKQVIPIDSKFSLENYNRLVEERDPVEREKLERVFRADLKNRIDETAKYVRPEENTMEFAFMFIPHEAIYYDLLVSQVGTVKVNTRDLIEYAFKERKVIITSPTSFLAYLQTVLQGLKAMQIEESAKEIRQRVEELDRHLRAYADYQKKLGRSLDTTVSHFNASTREFRKVDKDIVRIAGAASGAAGKIPLIEKSAEAEAIGAGE